MTEIILTFSKDSAERREQNPAQASNKPSLPAEPTGIEQPDRFFSVDDLEEDVGDNFENIAIPTIGITSEKVKRSFDSYQCPIIVVVDTSGIHQLRVRPCRCELHKSTPIFDQFLLSGLYPASTERTRTVFTFHVLDDYHLDNLESKATAGKYYEKLRRLTSNIFPYKVPDRYRELMVVARQWRDLKLRLRAGLLYEPEKEIPLGGLVLFCPACPQPSVNLPSNWKEDNEQ